MPEEKVLCMVCQMPSAIIDPETGLRLAKTMVRITGKKAKRDGLSAYVHESPCRENFIQLWAKHIAEQKEKEAFAGQGGTNDNNPGS